MLRKFIILNAVILQFLILSSAYSQNNLDSIEMSKYGTIYSNDDLGTRLRRLETDLFGMAQSGDLDTRMNMIEQMAGNDNLTSSVIPFDTYYPAKKESAIKRFFNNISSPLPSQSYITGYTPPINNMGFSNNLYGNNYPNFMNNPNNTFCPFHNNLRPNIPNQYHNHYYNNYNKYNKYNNYNYNRYTGNRYSPYRNNISRILPGINRGNNFYNRPYRYNPYYNPYTSPGIMQPTDMLTNVATRSTVHILQDWFYKIKRELPKKFSFLYLILKSYDSKT